MKLSTFTIIFALLFSSLFAQSEKNNAYKISYIQFSNGDIENSQSIDILYSNGVCFLSEPDNKISNYIDFNRSQNVNIIKSSDKYYKVNSSFNENPQPIDLIDKAEKVKGYKCKKAIYNSFSNKIEIWYTTKTKAKGSPYQRFLPTPNSLVVKIVINGNRTVLLDEISKISESELPEYMLDEATEISEPEFEELKILSRYTILPVFENERINFDPDMVKPSFETIKTDKTYHLSNGGIILKKVKLPQIASQGAYCFARLNVESAGDAYDRTGSVFIIPSSSDKTLLEALFEGPKILPVYTDKTGKEYQGYTLNDYYRPATEIFRFFTSFGAGHFNDKREINNYKWENKILYKQEITKLIPTNEEEVWIGVFIGNYDKGGHIVSLDLDFYPSFEENYTSQKFVLPLFNTVNILEMSGQNYCRFFNTDTLRMEFELPTNIENPELVFTTTGHGGWGNGDEFVPKQNQIYIDGKKVFEIVPWRTDCATYRFNNPASGNFGNGLSSSDLSRSNWCPGTLTPPYYIKLSELKPGKHIIEIVIDQGEDEGSSFSSWSVSGVICGELKE